MYHGRTEIPAPRTSVHTAACPTPLRRGRDTEWGPTLDTPGSQGHTGAERCFKCPKERRPGDPGWYFVEAHEPRKPLGPARLYVCPEDYVDFAAGERARWMPFNDETRSARGQNDAAPVPADPPTCSPDELIELLSLRGLAGWAFLVRDVAAGRVRRIHLRQLPADPEIRRALMAYLHSAGTAVTVSRSFLDNERRFRRA